MRIWDVDPGYLNRQSLLGEHRELHGMVNIIVHGRKGYANHPETLRWAPCGWALARRHRQLSAEMALRGYTDRTPVELADREGEWPASFIDPPAEQFRILREKYAGKPGGRIPLPGTTHELWAQHKYSVMARDYGACKSIGRRIAALHGREGFDAAALELLRWLRTPPTPEALRNTLEHMRGYVSEESEVRGSAFASMTPDGQLAVIRKAAQRGEAVYLLHSTALGELGAWL